jgi:hypothetical protein
MRILRERPESHSGARQKGFMIDARLNDDLMEADEMVF